MQARRSHYVGRCLATGRPERLGVSTIKQLYSPVDFCSFNGFSTEGLHGPVLARAVPYLHTGDFEFRYKNVSERVRGIDGPWRCSTCYTSTTMGSAANLSRRQFCRGRIKGYP